MNDLSMRIYPGPPREIEDERYSCCLSRVVNTSSCTTQYAARCPVHGGLALFLLKRKEAQP